VRLASYNVENLFARAKALNQDSWAEGRPVLERFGRLSALLGEQDYPPAAKAEMARLMLELGLERSDESPFVRLRRNRGALLRRPKTGGLEIVADGRAEWVGSLELKTEPVNALAMQNTARVIRDVGADVLGIIEVENRPALADFNALILPSVAGTAYAQVMVIDGNDPRGIDVGLLTRDGFRIGDMRSHVDDRTAGGSLVFSRDCPEFEVETPAGNRLLLMVNHLKSKGFGSQASSNARRLEQARRVREIYEARRREHPLIAILGDFNDTPDSAPLAPLFQGSGLRDAQSHAQFEDGGFPGTFGGSGASSRIDHILLSPALFGLMRGGGLFRKGMWPGVRPRKWDAYPEVSREVEAASDHAAVWVDLDA
jgi:endonuclease/exonuclease/phosphatase family metal-dependent hydrolase